MPPADSALPLRHAVALGLLQGPTELLPVSSSAHTTLVPWLAGWPYTELDGELRKGFEVALHLGAGLALAIGAPRPALGIEAPNLALAIGPPAFAGLLFGRAVERELGQPQPIALALLLGAAAMLACERRAGAEELVWREAEAKDLLVLGLAQALALIPGISRSGATITAARALGFAREDSYRLSWAVGLPVIAAAGMLQGARLLRSGLPADVRGAMAIGGASAFCSTLASVALARGARAASWPLAPFAVYRCLLAAWALLRSRSRG